MDKKSKVTIITSIIALSIVIITVTYAYFSARITGIESASTISLTAGTMGIHYAEGNETVSVSNIYPKADPWVTKTFTLTGNNTTNQTMEYQVGLQITTNTFKRGELSFSLEVGNDNVGTSMSPVTNKAIIKTSGTMLIGKGSFPGPVTNGAQTYTLKIYFLDTEKDQNINQGAVFNGKITVGDKGSIVAVNECTYDGEVTPGTLWQKDQYTYIYGQDFNSYGTANKTINGWWVVSTESVNYAMAQMGGGSYTTPTTPITDMLCTSINGEPIVSMMEMFYANNASSIDLSSFDTSNVTSMYEMFRGSAVTTLDLSSFDTSNVTDMYRMFANSRATRLDLSTFDTSNVSSMQGMFMESLATALDLSSFDTSNVINMNSMFQESTATTLDLSSFDTSNVTDMGWMFSYSAATSLDLSSFDTSNVTDMGWMFQESAVTSLDLSSFDTSKVTDMVGMFSNSAATIGYARTQVDANRFNNVAGSLSNGNNPDTDKPAALTFVVK